MIEIHGTVATPIAESMLYRLSRHFAKKIPVAIAPGRSHARFPFGECELAAADGALSFTCRAVDDQALAQLREVIEMHVGMFSKRAPLRVEWR